MVGGALGFGGGMLDYFLMRSLGVEMFLDGRDVAIWIVLFFALNLGALGALIGWSRVQRKILRAQNNHITAQQHTLLAKERELVEERSLATIGRLSSGVAHEVRNPLAIIRASASLICEELPETQQSHEVALFICDEVDRLDGFVERLMDYTRKLEPNMRAVSVAHVLERLKHLTAAHDRIMSGDVQLDHEAIDEHITCTADEDLLERQLLTILDNAIDAAAHKVVIRAHHTGHTLHQVDIADDGEGVDEADLANVFEPFFTKKATGTGLGLAMAAKIADLHHHTLSCVAHQGAGPDGEGACFVLDVTKGAQP